MCMKNALSQLRTKLGLSYRAMADKAGITAPAVFFHCNGKVKMSAENALKYNKAFDIPLTELRPDLWPPMGVQHG